jgi:uncharacterized protein GlcG (DUF336 family)
MTTLSLNQANIMINAALAKARELKLPPIGVAVVDAGGHLVAMQREDGLAFLRIQVCQAKAWGAVGMHWNTSEVAARSDKGGHFSGFIESLNALSGGRMVPLPGGVLIHDDNQAVIGAIGIAGAPSEMDEVCAIAGIKAAGLISGVQRES